MQGTNGPGKRVLYAIRLGMTILRVNRRRAAGERLSKVKTNTGEWGGGADNDDDDDGEEVVYREDEEESAEAGGSTQPSQGQKKGKGKAREESMDVDVEAEEAVPRRSSGRNKVSRDEVEEGEEAQRSKRESQQ